MIAAGLSAANKPARAEIDAKVVWRTSCRGNVLPA